MSSETRTLVRTLLLRAGIEGMSKTTLTIALRNTSDGDMIEDALEYFHRLGQIQKFVIPSKRQGGPPKTVWRATTNLAKEN